MAVMDEDRTNVERLTRLETQQEQNMLAITTLTAVVERLTRVEEPQQARGLSPRVRGNLTSGSSFLTA